jgi:hypothetical protein
LAAARHAVAAERTRVQAAANSLADATHEAAKLVLAERAGEDQTAKAVEGAASEEQLVGEAVLRAEATDEERETESARAIERAAEKVKEAESRNVVEEKELRAVTERESKSLTQQHQDLAQQVAAAAQALTSAQAELDLSKRKEVEMLGRLEQVQSDAKELDAKLVTVNQNVGVVHPEPIVALQKDKQTTGRTANSVPHAARALLNQDRQDDESEDDESDDAESDGAESDDDDDEDASNETVSKIGKAGPAHKSEFDLDLP